MGLVVSVYVMAEYIYMIYQRPNNIEIFKEIGKHLTMLNSTAGKLVRRKRTKRELWMDDLRPT